MYLLCIDHLSLCERFGGLFFFWLVGFFCFVMFFGFSVKRTESKVCSSAIGSFILGYETCWYVLPNTVVGAEFF